ncbi:MAG: putative 5-nucleotidase [Blastococcus sp.]|nr:putative 5-nucleotidase [Blastococcus sp.]
MRRTRLSLALAVALAASAVVAGLPAGASAARTSVSAQRVAADIPVQLLAMNDFHGRISETAGGDAVLVTGEGNGPDGTPDPPGDTTPDDGTLLVGGAANVASTVADTREAFVEQGGSEASSLFVGAGDLISASPFNSSVFKDEPAIDVLNAMGLDVSSVGNHEFDRGTEELRRVSAATDGTYSDDVTACEGVEKNVTGCFTDSSGADFQGAEFPYLAANVLVKGTETPALPPYQVFTVGGGRKLALIGVVTETTPTIVDPNGVRDVTFIDEADAVNRWVPVLQRQGIEAIGVLVHEGGANTGEDNGSFNGCDELSGPVVDINNRVLPAVDLIVSAHTHQSYDCLLADPAGRPRLVTQAGFYGRLISDVRLTIDGTTGDVERFCADYRAANVPVTRDDPDPEVAAVVNYWDDKSKEAGSRVVGTATADIERAYGRDPKTGATVPVRDAESPLGDLVAQMQLEAVRSADYGNPVVAFMNPGGLRTDISAGAVTYSELYAVQPFGNTVDVITLTGSDIRAVLEQQFLGGTRTSQLMLGTSEGFSYRYDLSQDYRRKVDPNSVTLNGTLIEPAGSYRVVANSFLVAGGDSFTAFTRGTDPATGPVDVDTSVAYFQARDSVSRPAPDHAREADFAAAPEPADIPTGGPTPPTTAVADGTTAVTGPGTTGPNCDATASISDDNPHRGQPVTLTGTAFATGEKVSAVLVQGPRTLGTATATAHGKVTIAFVVPNRLRAGEFRVRLTGQRNGESAFTSFALPAR